MSYHEKAIQMFGPVETFSNYDAKYNIDTNYALFKYSRKDFNDQKWKPKTDLDKPLVSPNRLPEEYRL